MPINGPFEGFSHLVDKAGSTDQHGLQAAWEAHIETLAARQIAQNPATPSEGAWAQQRPHTWGNRQVGQKPFLCFQYFSSVNTNVFIG